MRKILSGIWKFVWNSRDYIFLVGALAFLLFSIFDSQLNLWEIRAFGLLGLTGTVYCACAIMELVFSLPRFDYRLVNGHFLRKAACMVVLMPYVLALFYFLFCTFCNVRTLDDVKDKILLLKSESSVFENELKVTARDAFYDENMYEGTPWNLDDSKDSASQKSDKVLTTPLVSVFWHFVDPGNQFMAVAPYGRVWSAVFAIFGVLLLNGLLVSSLVGWIERRRERWLAGEIRYNSFFFSKNRYALVIGANEIASSVIKNLLTRRKRGDINFKSEANNSYVILQTCREVKAVRSELASYLTERELKKVIIYSALRNSRAEIQKLHIYNASEIYVIGETTTTADGETFHDAMNMQCVNIIADLLDEYRKENILGRRISKKICKVMFDYQTTSSIFQFSDIPQKVKDNLVFIPFNKYEAWARKVIVDNSCKIEGGCISNFSYVPLDADGFAPDSDNFVHLVIVGMSKMGVALGVEAMLQAHYMNSRCARTRITFIDTNVDTEMNFFKGRYENLFNLVRTRYLDVSKSPKDIATVLNKAWDDPFKQEPYKWNHLSCDGENFLDIEIEFVKGELESDGVREYLKTISRDEKAVLHIAICITQAHRAIAAAIYMPIEVYENKCLQQILVYQLEAADIVSNLISKNANEQKDLRYARLRPFGMLYGEYMCDRNLYLKSILTNMAYDVNCAKNEKSKAAAAEQQRNNLQKIGKWLADKILKILGKQKPRAVWPKTLVNKKDEGYKYARNIWKKLSVEKKWSNKYFADSIYTKIRNIHHGDSHYKSLEDIREMVLVKGKKAVLNEIATAIDQNRESLADCEHNRWVIQQLILGYSPCDKELDDVFVWNNKYNQEQEEEKKKEYNAKVQEGYKSWKEVHAHYKDDEKEDSVEPDTENNNKLDIKNDVKLLPQRIHPNICDYNHLDDVDSGAKLYDSVLNAAIPDIIELVDFYKDNETIDGIH